MSIHGSDVGVEVMLGVVIHGLGEKVDEKQESEEGWVG